MVTELDHYARGVMGGADRRPSAAILRLGLSAAEPFYAAMASLRNWLFDAGLRPQRRLPRPTISVGNITTGGTGKTPVVRWLAQRLRENACRVAVLSRGYKSAGGGALGDEQLMLDCALNGPAEQHRVTIVADPDRMRGAQEALRRRRETEVFLLDDGFQHRRVARDLDVVLVSASDPFGYGHVLPRGMLREPLRGLRRAGAFIITHADQVNTDELAAIENTLRRHNRVAPVYHASHALAAARTAVVNTWDPADRSPGDLRGQRFFAFCGIGDPQGFLRQLQGTGGTCAGRRWFGDHHRYTENDLAEVRREAAAAGANVLLTTEKDWAKLQGLRGARAGEADGALSIWRVDLEIRFRGDDGTRLLEQAKRVLRAVSQQHPSSAAALPPFQE